jgi:hypothetical protein
MVTDQTNPTGLKRVKILKVYPRRTARPALSPDVPDAFAVDYYEACNVMSESPKASAALGRRCLQHLLRSKANVGPSDLAREIDELLSSNTLPNLLAQSVDAVRTIGNFAAHPSKSRSTGEIVDVEPGEAEWILETLEGLFEFYFVQPAELQRKRDALNAKLASIGKPPLK